LFGRSSRADDEINGQNFQGTYQSQA